MYIAAPPGTKILAKYLLPTEEYNLLEEVDFNVYGEEKSLTIVQFMRDLKWIYISYDEGDKISLKPTETGIEIFERGLTPEYMEKSGDLVSLVKKYLEGYLTADMEITEETLKLSEFYLKSGNYNRALDLASSLIDLGNRNSDRRLLGRGHYVYGAINLYKMDLEFAKNHFEKAKYFSENVDDITTAAKSDLGMGSYFGYKGDMNRAMEMFEHALLLFQEVGDDSGVNQVKMNEAFTLVKMGNVKEFFSLNHQAIDFFNTVTDNYHLQWCYQNESAVLLSLGKYDAAIDAVVEAHNLAKETGNEMIENRSGLSIALIYIYTMRPGDAYEYVETAMRYFRKNFDTNGLATCYEMYMLYDIATKNLDAADVNLEKSRQNFMVKKQLPYIVELYTQYLKILKIYRYDPKIIEVKTKQFQNLANKLGLKELFSQLME
ncbi:MAG: hypothetical protein M1129_02635 [Candidatus Thermoplasmatota archaeon]|jgi:tetratricopeptide (TPR) repeat protein|nr:hypothetical protein [Candidatus Thermoplasmatota archaeon]MCL5954652.1 hypothetical protein [Candidatus Thermoplasmatota archaeon]